MKKISSIDSYRNEDLLSSNLKDAGSFCDDFSFKISGLIENSAEESEIGAVINQIEEPIELSGTKPLKALFESIKTVYFSDVFMQNSKIASEEEPSFNATFLDFIKNVFSKQKKLKEDEAFLVDVQEIKKAVLSSLKVLENVFCENVFLNTEITKVENLIKEMLKASKEIYDGNMNEAEAEILREELDKLETFILGKLEILIYEKEKQLKEIEMNPLKEKVNVFFDRVNKAFLKKCEIFQLKPEKEVLEFLENLKVKLIKEMLVSTSHTVENNFSQILYELMIITKKETNDSVVSYQLNTLEKIIRNSSLS